MLKKSLIIFSIFALMLFISSPVFASNMMQGAENTLNNIKGGIQNMASDAGNAMEDAKDGISNVVTDMKDGAENMGRDVKNDAEGAMEDTNSNGYTASRTSATGMGGTSTFNNPMVWIVLAITGAIIVALVWYYGSQVNTER